MTFLKISKTLRFQKKKKKLRLPKGHIYLFLLFQMSGSRQSATSIHAIMLQSESSIDTNLALTTPLVATHSSPPYMLHLGPDGMPGQLNS